MTITYPHVENKFPQPLLAMNLSGQDLSSDGAQRNSHASAPLSRISLRFIRATVSRLNVKTRRAFQRTGFQAEQFTFIKTPFLTGPVNRDGDYLSTSGKPFLHRWKTVRPKQATGCAEPSVKTGARQRPRGRRDPAGPARWRNPLPRTRAADGFPGA